MKLLFINKFLYQKGGAETYMFQLSESLKRCGVEIAFWGMHDDKNIVSDNHKCFAPNIAFSGNGILKNFARAAQTIYSYENKQRLSVVLDAFRPDIVHLHNFNFQLTPSILDVIHMRHIKTVVTLHDSQIACPYHRLYNFRKNHICVKCTQGAFWHCFVNRCFNNSFTASFIGSLESYFYHIFNYYNRYIDLFISPSQFLARIIQPHLRNKIIVLPNYMSDIDKLSDLRSRSKKRSLLYVGRISGEKGIIELAKMIAREGIDMDIIGDGSDRDKIEVSDKVRYLGPIHGAELYRNMADAKFIIQPSKGYENCPMTIIESFMCGTPIIAPCHSGFLEMVKDGINGFLLDFEKSDNISKCIVELLKRNIVGLRENCIKTFNEQYSEKVHLYKILQIYKNLINENS